MSTRRLVPAFAALVCALSVALGAYASHVAAPDARQRLVLAAAFGFAHGLTLIVLDGRQTLLAHVGKGSLFAGIVLFCGSLASAGLFATSTAAVPYGGSLLILGWLLLAVDFLRTR